MNTTEQEIDKIFYRRSCYPGTEGINVTQAKQAISRLVTEAREAYHNNYSGIPEEHPVPCQDCGSKVWVDYLLPHPVFNAVCPGGAGYLCLLCFAKRQATLTQQERSEK